MRPGSRGSPETTPRPATPRSPLRASRTAPALRPAAPRAATPPEQEAGVEDHELRAGRLGDPGRVVEHPDGHVQLLAALGVAHEARDRGVHAQHDPLRTGELAEPPGEVVVHPEPLLEVDLARRIAALDERLDR